MLPSHLYTFTERESVNFVYNIEENGVVSVIVADLDLCWLLMLFFFILLSQFYVTLSV